MYTRLDEMMQCYQCGNWMYKGFGLYCSKHCQALAEYGDE